MNMEKEYGNTDHVAFIWNIMYVIIYIYINIYNIIYIWKNTLVHIGTPWYPAIGVEEASCLGLMCFFVTPLAPSYKAESYQPHW
jgi:hypothetical protein